MNQTYPLTVYVNKKAIQSGQQGDYQMKINVPILSTSLHIIKTILHSKQIQLYSAYALYQTYLIHDQKSSSYHRKFIRQLENTEHPLLITDLSSAFKSPPYTLYLTTIAPENNPDTFISSFHILRKEQCKALPLGVLQRRLAGIEEEEEAAFDAIQSDFMYASQFVVDRIAALEQR